MDCPACDATQPEPVGTECARCGIVFAKVRVDHGQPSSARVSSTDDTGPATWSDRPQAARVALIGRGILYVCLLIWTWRFVSQPMGTAAMSSVLHGVNLVFHEAGHVLFLPVGAFLTALGGSLMQLLVPMMCLVALVRQNRDAFGGSLALCWCCSAASPAARSRGTTGRPSSERWAGSPTPPFWARPRTVWASSSWWVRRSGAQARSPPSGDGARAVRRRDARAAARIDPGCGPPRSSDGSSAPRHAPASSVRWGYTQGSRKNKFPFWGVDPSRLARRCSLVRSILPVCS